MFPATSMPDSDWWQVLWPNPKEVLHSIDVTSDMIVIDLCCGDGYFTVPLAEMTAKVYGLELDGALLDKADKLASFAGIHNCKWIQVDAMEITKYLPELVDYVLLANTFHGIPDKERLVRNVSAVLKVGGQFAIINWYPKPREQTTVLGLPRGPKTEMRMSPDQVDDIMLPLGFERKKVVDVSLYHYASVYVKMKESI